MDPRVEVEIARRYLVGNWQSVSHYDGWSHRKAEHHEQCINVWSNIPDRILTASPHLQGYDVPGDEIDRLKAQGLTLLEALEELGID